jgi:hypothetical protein
MAGSFRELMDYVIFVRMFVPTNSKRERGFCMLRCGDALLHFRFVI